MDESAFQQPTTEQLLAFAQGDPVAKNEIAHLTLPQLTRWAKLHYWNLPPDEVQSVVNGALAEILRNHERYDPDQVSFTTYAINLIKLRLNSLYHALKKIKEFQTAHENLLQPMYNKIGAEEVYIQIERDRFFGAAMKSLEGAEKDFLSLMLQGEKQSCTFVAVLARYGPINNSSRDVKNMKARLLHKLQSIAREMGYEAGDLVEE